MMLLIWFGCDTKSRLLVVDWFGLLGIDCLMFNFVVDFVVGFVVDGFFLFWL